MDIAKEKADLRTRQQAVIEAINELTTQEQQLAAQKQELMREALQLNGEARLLERLSKNDDKENDGQPGAD